jgi:hypothetical protein
VNLRPRHPGFGERPGQQLEIALRLGQDLSRSGEPPFGNLSDRRVQWSWLLEDAWVRDLRYEFVNAGPGNGPSLITFHLLAHQLECDFMERSVRTMAIDQDVGIKGDQSRSLYTSSFIRSVSDQESPSTKPPCPNEQSFM